MGDKNLNDITDSKIQVELGVNVSIRISRAALLFKVPVYFQSSTRISKMFLIVFVFDAGNIYVFFRNCKTTFD